MAKKPHNEFIYLLIIAGVALAVLYLLQYHPASAPKSFTLNNRTYAVTAYASTPSQLEKGLMNASVTNSTFMLFAFGKPGVYLFWMKNTYAPLDIMWIDYNSTEGIGRIVYYANATPCISYDKNQKNCMIYTPTSEANYVLEAKAGFVQASKISNGTIIRFNYN